MIARPFFLAVTASMLASAIVGCSAASTGPQPPPPVNVDIVDPVGDTCGPAAGQNNACSLGTALGATIYDITDVKTSRTGPVGGTYTQITVTITFAQPVVIPAAGGSPDVAGTQLIALLLFDTDGNFTDGENFVYCGPLGTYNGVDYSVDASSRLADGNYPINVLPANTQTGEATVAVSGNSITFTVPISAIGNHPAGPFNFGLTVGNEPTPSDCAANAGFTPASVVSHPASVVKKPGVPWWQI